MTKDEFQMTKDTTAPLLIRDASEADLPRELALLEALIGDERIRAHVSLPRATRCFHQTRAVTTRLEP